MRNNAVDNDRHDHTGTSTAAVRGTARDYTEADEKAPTLAQPVSLIKPALLALALSTHAGWAAADDDNPWTLNLYFENDLFRDTDRNYTNGIRASWVSPNVYDYLQDKTLPSWVREINSHLPLFDPDPTTIEHVQRNLVLSLGQVIYTPSDINRTTVDPNDRPYAGWLYGSIGYHSRTRDRMNSVELNVGVVGPAALGQEAQDFVHDLRGFDKFQGWDNQLDNEPGIQLVYERKNRVLQKALIRSFGYDLILHGGGSLGNVATYANAGASARIGWRLPKDFGTSALRPGGDNSAPGFGDDRYHLNSRNDNIGAHLFISGDGKWVLHDIFLDGNTFSDSHSIDKEPLVGELSVGAAMLYQGWKFSYARIYRSREFKGQADTHSYGSLSISYTF